MIEWNLSAIKSVKVSTIQGVGARIEAVHWPDGFTAHDHNKRERLARNHVADI